MNNTTDNGIARQFSTGATRGTSDGKLDYEGSLCPFVLELFVQYMHKNRIQSDGKLRTADNWQKGIPKEEYMKSKQRHSMAYWKKTRSNKTYLTIKETYENLVAENNDLCGELFNTMGILHENLKEMGKME